MDPSCTYFTNYSLSVVDCGSPVVSPYFTTDYTGTLFGDNVDYECVEGYSLNPTDPSEKSSNAQCQANKTLSFTPNCQGELLITYKYF